MRQSHIEVNNTVMVTCLFTDPEGDGVYPDTVDITLYDAQKNSFHTEEITANLYLDGNGDAVTGKYFYYLNPTTTGVFYIEFKGMLGSSPIVIRQPYKVGFAV